MIFIKIYNYKLKWKSIVVSVINLSLLYTSIKIFFMTIYRITGFGSFFASLWDFNEKTGLYFVVNTIYNHGKGIHLLYFVIIVDLIFILVMGCMLAINNSGIKLLIIQHSSLQKMNFLYDSNDLMDYVDTRFHIDQYELLNDSGSSMEEKIDAVILDIKAKVPQILRYVEKGYQISYSGIANIPATFMLGYELDDVNQKLIFHKRRDNPSDDKFHMLKNEPRQLKFTSSARSNNPNIGGKILIVIQLTQPIKDSDIQSVLESNDYIIRYEIPETINYDVVDSAYQINDYTSKIISDVSEIQKNPNITEIKICVAASSAFIFALGTKFSKTQNIDTVIYHFQNGSYPWGINVTKGTAVIHNKQEKN